MSERSPAALLRALSRVTPLSRTALAGSVALGLAATAAVLVQALAIADLVGAAYLHHGVTAGADVAWLAGATALRALALGLGEPLASRLAAPARRDLRARLLDRVLERGPLASVDATALLAGRGVDAVEAYLAADLPQLILATLVPIGLLVWLAWRDPLSAVVVAVSVAILPLFMVLLGLEAKERMARRWAEQRRLAERFGDVVRGMGVLKSYRRSESAVARLDEVGATLTASTMDTLKVAFLSGFALELLSSLATALVALELGLRLLGGHLALSSALAVLLVTPEVYLPLRRASARFHASANGVAAAEELLGALAEEPAGLRPAPLSPPALELRAVAVRSGGGEQVLSLAVARGALVEVVGPSGSGKSTVLRLLAGLEAPRAGEVLIDGVDPRAFEPAAWGRAVAWVPQDPALPGETVGAALDNGRGLSRRRLQAALEALGLEIGLDRPLGEAAAALSAGQRRRLALARALLGEPVLLLLDEPTSHLDDDAAARVWAAIDASPATVVVATHDPRGSSIRLDLGEGASWAR